MTERRIFLLTQAGACAETFLDLDMRLYYQGKSHVIKLRFESPRARSIRSVLNWACPIKFSLLRHWKHMESARKLVIAEGIRSTDTLVAYWSNHIFSIGYRIHLLTGCALDVCCHARDIFVDSYLGKIPARHVNKYFFCCEKSMLWSATKFGLPRDKTYYRPHGVPEFPLHQSGSNREFKILNVARDVPKKNLVGVVRLLNRLAEIFHSIHFIQIGAPTSGLERGLDTRIQVRILENVAQKAVLEHMASCDLFIYGSRIALDGDRDGIPNVMKEAMGVGLPILAEAGWANREFSGRPKTLIVDDFDSEFDTLKDWLTTRFPEKLLSAPK